MNFTKILDTFKKTPGVNTKKHLIVHHTAGGSTVNGVYKYPSFEGMASFLSGDPGRSRDVSVHYVVGEKGEIAKIGKHTDILWHAGDGFFPWETISKKRNLNSCTIGIEVCSDGIHFTDAQRKATKELIQHICVAERIPKEGVLRHADIAAYRGKVDIGVNFFAPQTWSEYLSDVFGEDLREENRSEVIHAFQALYWLFEDRWEMNKEKRDGFLSLFHRAAEMERGGVPRDEHEQKETAQLAWKYGHSEGSQEIMLAAEKTGHLVRIFLG